MYPYWPDGGPPFRLSISYAVPCFFLFGFDVTVLGMAISAFCCLVSRKLLAGVNRRGVACDMPDQPAFLRTPVLVPDGHKLRQFHLRKFGKGTRKGRLVGQCFAVFPAADQAQLLVAVEAFQKIAGARQIVNSFGNKRAL